MALINCPECSSEVSDQAPTCPRCGVPIASAPKDVLVHVQRLGGQLFNIGVTIFDGTGKILAKGKQGDTLRLAVTAATEIELKASGSFGRARQTVQPGDRYNARPRRGGYYFEKVDVVTGI